MMLGSRDGNEVILRDETGQPEVLVTITAFGPENEWAASTVADRVADLDLTTGVDSPSSTADYSMVRTAVDGELVVADNPIDYLVMLLVGGKRYDGNWGGDDEQVAQWAVAQCCQELGWVPDLRDYDAGEQVERGDEIACLDTAFDSHIDSSQQGTDA